jgi:hypothetical protein
VNECGDQSDERACALTTTTETVEQTTCGQDEFACTSMTFWCIDKSWKCDGFADCPDESVLFVVDLRTCLYINVHL